MQKNIDRFWLHGFEINEQKAAVVIRFWNGFRTDFQVSYDDYIGEIFSWEVQQKYDTKTFEILDNKSCKTEINLQLRYCNNHENILIAKKI